MMDNFLVEEAKKAADKAYEDYSRKSAEADKLKPKPAKADKTSTLEEALAAQKKAHQDAAVAREREAKIDNVTNKIDDLAKKLGQPNIMTPVNIYDKMETQQTRLKAYQDYATSLPNDDPRKKEALNLSEKLREELKKAGGQPLALEHITGGHIPKG
jgi:SpoVK/Ycf46/Vps4 family AAA+-type ATPase